MAATGDSTTTGVGPFASVTGDHIAATLARGMLTLSDGQSIVRVSPQDVAILRDFLIEHHPATRRIPPKSESARILGLLRAPKARPMSAHQICETLRLKIGVVRPLLNALLEQGYIRSEEDPGSHYTRAKTVYVAVFGGKEGSDDEA